MEKKLISLEMDEIDDQFDREVLELKVGFVPKYKKFTEQHNKTLKEINIYKADIKT